MIDFMITSSPLNLPQLSHFDWPVEAEKTCPKDVKKLSQTNQKLCPSGNRMTRRIVILLYH